MSKKPGFIGMFLKRTKKRIIKADKKLYKAKDKLEKKIEGVKHIGKPAKKVFAINNKFNKKYPKSGKAIDYGIIASIPVPFPLVTEGLMASKAVGASLLDKFLKKKKKK